MSDQATFLSRIDGQVAGGGRLLLLDAAWRLGPRPVALRLADQVLRRGGLARLRLLAQPVPSGRFLPAKAPPAPPLPPGVRGAVLGKAAALPVRPDWHGGFDSAAHALDITVHQRGGARPVWEANRLAALPLLAQAARVDPDGGHLARAEALTALWSLSNPPFRGVAWACGQEAAFRALHLALALALLDADRDPPEGSRALLRLCARRIAATQLYALAQDNNHPLSEAAGAYACALLLGGDITRPAAALAARMARLVAPDGGFAQVSPGYTRALLDTLSVVEWLRRRHGAPAFPAPLAERAAALTAWLHRLVEPATGATPRLGLEDGAALADLALAGPADARASVERAARLFAGCGADAPEDSGCAWLGLPRPARSLERPPRWLAAGSMGWAEAGAAAVLRTGPLRFRPGQCDLLHLSLRDGATWVIRDGGTGSYDPPSAWWWPALAGAAGHNGPMFDGEEPMPRAGRFLLARWSRIAPLPDGAALRDANGNAAAREVRVAGRHWTVEDRIAGPFLRVAWHWRLCPGPWRLDEGGAVGPAAAIAVQADASLRIRLAQGWESPAYGAIQPTVLLLVEAEAPVSHVTMRIRLP
jgi:hypothetical protein